MSAGFLGRINGRYGAAWWALVYAAQPSYRAKREDLPLAGSLIEQDAERAAIIDCQRRGILDPDPMPERARRNYRPERAVPARVVPESWWI